MTQDKYPIERFVKCSSEEVEAWEYGYDYAKEEIKKNIGQLRQYLNERTSDKLITDEELKTFLIS